MNNLLQATLRFVLVVVFLSSSTFADDEVAPDHATRMAQGRELFKKEVRQVLVGRCLKCHGGESTEAEFNLATRESLLRGGEQGKAIDLKDTDESLLLKLIRHEDDPIMPEDGAKLDQRQIDSIAKWISLGAPYDKPLDGKKDDDPLAWTRRVIDDSSREFWSFQPLKNVKLPEIPEKGDDAWLRTSVDDLVMRKLDEKGLVPNQTASRQTLIRRAYFDLIGLPPTPAEVDEFINDTDPYAYEKLIDRLLESKHHGERVARHWLDIARFAESHGFEQDYDRPHAYHYRDFLIKAFNTDMPFDQFVRWQIAGDEIAPDNPLALMATGFLGAGVFPTQLTEKEFESSRYDELDDMVATMGTAMLGVTIGCARCHDHKFDPIPSRDYYSLVSAFRTAIRSNVELDLNAGDHDEALRKWQAGLSPLRKALEDFERVQLPKRFEKFVTDMRSKKPSERKIDLGSWVTLKATSIHSTSGATFTEKDDGSYVVSGKNGNTDAYVFTTSTSLTNINALRLEALADDSMKRRGPGRAGNGNFGLSKIELLVQPAGSDQSPQMVKLSEPQVTFEQNKTNLSIKGSLDNDPKTGWAVDPKFGQDHAASFKTESPVGFRGGTRITVRLEFKVNGKHNIGRLRLAVATDDERPGLDSDSAGQDEAELGLFHFADGAELTETQRKLLLAIYRKTDSEWRKLNGALQKHLAAKPKPKLTKVMVTSEGVKPIPNHGDNRGFPHFYKESFFLNRGDVNQKQGVAKAGYLQVLVRHDANDQNWKPNPPKGSSTSYRRTAVADWLTDTEDGAGHLLARVIVNRLWQQHLGRGIVSTPNDFGFQGRRPTHPELLDWLAGELIKSNWRLKPIRKLIMTSNVYMQKSAFNQANATIDPKNEMFWRFTPRRLEAEIIRDTMLAVSGQLDETQFGPGTLDQNMRRRSIYFFIKRSKLIPFLQVFDTPEPLASVGSRPATTIAPQALIFMNNPQVRELAVEFAKSSKSVDVETSIRKAYKAGLARKPTEDELRKAARFIQRQRESYKSESESKADELALADLCQVLMSLNEFIYIN